MSDDQRYAVETWKERWVLEKGWGKGGLSFLLCAGAGSAPCELFATDAPRRPELLTF